MCCLENFREKKTRVCPWEAEVSFFSSDVTVAPTPWIRFDDVTYGGNKPPKPGRPDFQFCCAEVILANAIKSLWD